MSTASDSKAPKKTAARKKAPARKASAEAPSLLTLDYRLAQLPSAQHRAGLAGLVALLGWLEQLPGEKPGTARVVELDDSGARVELDEAGLRRLLDEFYAASTEERRELKRREGEPPLREEDEEKTDEKGKVQRRHYFIYPVPVPRAGLLARWDPTCGDGRQGAWVKLWRDMLWQTLRGVPATRQPFEARAEGRPTKDVPEAWKALTRPEDTSVALSSTDFIGAMERSADNVPFMDRARHQFLLQFWPWVAQVYVPQKLSVKDGRTQREHHGYALVVPDVARLKTFCEELPHALEHRGTKVDGYRPREALVDVALESALAFGQRLRERLKARLTTSALSPLVLGYEVFHLGKEGNNVRLHSTARLTPSESMFDAYATVREGLWDPLFRRTRLLNVLEQRAWYAGFDRIASTHSYKTTFGAPYFRHDARVSFENVEREAQAMNAAETPDAERSLELLVLKLVQEYVKAKVKRKTGLERATVKGKPDQEKDYNDAKERIARDAFLAVRSRTGQDFIAYFAGTLCSVPHFLKSEEFVRLSRALHERHEEVRTLTLLALSANG